MAKKIKKKAPPQHMIPAIELEDVQPDQAFECELDIETQEIVLVNHYRKEWDDGFDADVEHGMSLDEAKQFVAALLGMIDELEKLNQLVGVRTETTGDILKVLIQEEEKEEIRVVIPVPVVVETNEDTTKDKAP